MAVERIGSAMGDNGGVCRSGGIELDSAVGNAQCQVLPTLLGHRRRPAVLLPPVSEVVYA